MVALYEWKASIDHRVLALEEWQSEIEEQLYSHKQVLALVPEMGSRHFFLPESPLSLVSCLLKRLILLPGSHFWAKC